MSRSLPYRPEIDGLRAVAVGAVILYHGQILNIAPGGLLGVDIFFVISGYLITLILARDLTGERFSILRFYERRIRRIIPALMLVMLLCIPVAWYLMLPDDLENFGQSLAGTTLFANNIVLLMTSGYFAPEVQFKPLMHTWSLGVEEQYYLLVPLMLWAAWRLGRARGLLIGIALVTIASFIACLVLARTAPQANFFLIVSRGWELGAGSLVALIEPRLRPRVAAAAAASLAFAGLAMIVAPMAIGLSTYAPGAPTLIPVAGTCLILLFGGARDPAGRLLSSRPFVAIGLISYSLYLFHQPFFAFARIASAEPPGAVLMAGLLVPIFLCAWASWRFVEQPFRDARRVATRTVLLVSAAAALVTLGAGLTFHFKGGFMRNWPELYDPNLPGKRPNIAYNLAPERFARVELPPVDDKVRVLVIGNSFARDFINMALETGQMTHHRVSFAFLPDCAALTPRMRARARNADFIVLSTRFQAHGVPCITDLLTRLRRETPARLIVIGRKSFGYNNNAVMLLPAGQRAGWHVAPVDEAVAANAAAKRVLPPDIYVDMIAMLANAEGKVPVFTPDGKFISQDREHLTRYGAIHVGGIVFRHPALQALLDARPATRTPAGEKTPEPAHRP
jgi:peptidoglycan/LPS O-acetylase OafA/YrhL